ncbi:hypothetical protein LXT21_28115 [Myxococcus sp. K38C18041901]|uniref:hypothetical protein n=1 Tax=Myxococcus guangdongensis TaxID=2906760 RepID=UPI0020A765E2|nr:hypothetical protein [Myxococcus guangdongensis]MCP3062656.1 hypothetical protein [Myxococcus guangdongensis]
MSANIREKYYEGFLVDPQNEVPAEKARQARRYSRALYGPAEQLQKVEQYENGKVRRVDYFEVAQDDAIKKAHVPQYGSVPFVTHRQLPQSKGFSWKSVHMFSASGELSEVITILRDASLRECMEVSASADRRVSKISKYYWASAETLKFVFEYDGKGTLLEVADVPEGGHTSLPEVRSQLPDVSFFEDGLRLPAPLAGTSIPS